MIDVRPFATLGHRNHGWLDTHFHFSFADYHEPSRMGWDAIRVWNDDLIAPQSGFPPHPHRDMEIITFVRKGAITHKDSMGNVDRTVAGDVQVMSAGTGVEHAEYNIENEDTQIFQIWIIPNSRGYEPRWGTKQFPSSDGTGSWTLLASGSDQSGKALPIHADAQILATKLTAGQSAIHQTLGDRHQYLVATGGRIKVNGVQANPQDGIAITGEATITVEAVDDAEVVLVDAL